MLKTKLTELLGIEYPIFQGGMSWIADAKLAAAVSEGGGLGIIAASNAPVEVVREMVREAKSLTDKPFGVNIMLMSDNAPAVAQMVIDEQVAVVTTGAGNPGKYIEGWKAAGIKVIPVVPTVALARRMERAGADAVIAEGTEAGGHIGELTTMALVPQVADAVNIPVIAAGGIADARGVSAALMLGAEGVQLGTIFICAQESPAHPDYKQLILDAKDTDTVVTGRANGHPVRSLKNKFPRRILEMEKADAGFEAIENATVGSYRKAVQDGNMEEGTFMSGQIAGMVKEIQPAAKIVGDLMASTEEYLKTFTEKRGITLG